MPVLLSTQLSIAGRANRTNAQGEHSVLRCPPPLYQALNQEEGLRGEVYRESFRYQLDLGLVDQIRAATSGNYALGSPRFAAEVEIALGRRAVRGKPGRPKRRPGF